MIMSAIAATTKKHITKVRTPDVDTEPLQILAGMQKGDTLAASLFIIALDYALRCVINGKEDLLDFTLSKRASRLVPAKTLKNLESGLC